MLRIIITIAILLVSETSLAADNTLTKYRFEPSSTRVADVNASQLKASQQHKKLLLVLGAQWCHDSTGFAKKMSTPVMQSIIERDYVVQIVDVGHLEDRRTITQMFGYPTYFATPTVLVIDPNQQQILNMATLSQWGHADSISLKQYQRYFSNLEVSKIQPELSPAMNQYIDQGVDKLHTAYQLLGANMNKNSAAFYQLWGEVKTYRMALQQQVVEAKLGESDTLPTTPLDTTGQFEWPNK